MLKKFKSTSRELGFFNAVLYGVSLVLARLPFEASLFRYLLVAQPVATEPLTPPGRGASITCREIRDGEFDFSRLGRPSPAIRHRYDQGAICLGSYKGDDLIAFAWLSLGPYVEDEVRCRFFPVPREVAAWDLDVYIDPAHRFGFAFPRVWDEVNRYLSAHNRSWSMSRISAFNQASIAAHSRLGARRLGSATYVRIAKVQVMISGLRPYLHLSLGAGSIPELVLRAPGTD